MLSVTFYCFCVCVCAILIHCWMQKLDVLVYFLLRDVMLVLYGVCFSMLDCCCHKDLTDRIRPLKTSDLSRHKAGEFPDWSALQQEAARHTYYRLWSR